MKKSKNIDLSQIPEKDLIMELERRKTESREKNLKNSYFKIKRYCELNNIQPTYQIDTEDGYDMVNNSYFWVGVIINGKHIDYYAYTFDNAYELEDGTVDFMNLIPHGFAESSESHYEFRGPAEKAIDILRQCGYIEFVPKN